MDSLEPEFTLRFGPSTFYHAQASRRSQVAFVVETGSGASDATSYVSLTDANSYFSDRSNTTWSAATDAAKQSSLIKATQFLDAAQVWKGTRANETQSLKWPRIGVYDEDEYYIGETTIPQKLKDCTCEFALLDLGGTALITTYSKSVVQERIEGAVMVRYKESSPDGIRYDDLWLLVAGLTTGSSLMGVNVRS